MYGNNMAQRCITVVHDGYLSNRDKGIIMKRVESRFKAMGYGTEKNPIPTGDLAAALEKEAAKRLNKKATRKAR